MNYSRVLVTGASGLLGTRVAEHLRIGHGIPVRGTVRNPARAVRLARLDVEIVRADVLDRASVVRSLEGCDAVVHCAYGTEGGAKERREVTGRGTGVVAEAALEAGVRRFVHLSSAVVWGFDPGAVVLDERMPVRRTGHPYVDGKIDAEAELAAVAGRGLPVVVLRPTNVFGPWAAAFTAGPVAALRAGAVALVGDGAAPANTVYVDNVVHAILLALENERAVGETFVVCDEDGPGWRALYEAYARLASPPLDVRSLPADEYRRLRRHFVRPLFGELRAVARSSEARALVRAAAEQPAVRAFGRRAMRLVPGGRRRATGWADDGAASAPLPAAGPAALPSEELVQLQTSGVRYRTDKARSVLGYEPPVPFELALRLTGEWLRFARLI